mgnify:CR=1 FL=1
MDKYKDKDITLPVPHLTLVAKEPNSLRIRATQLLSLAMSGNAYRNNININVVEPFTEERNKYGSNRSRYE